MLRALNSSLEKSRAQQASKAVRAHSQDLIRFSAVDLVGQLFLPSRLRGLFASGRRDVEPGILPTRPLSVVTSAVNSFAVTWVQSVLGIGATCGWCASWSSLVSTFRSLFCQCASHADRHFQSDSPHHSQCDSNSVPSAWLSRVGIVACTPTLLDPQRLRHLSPRPACCNASSFSSVSKRLSETSVTSSSSSSDTVTSTEPDDFSGAGVLPSKAVSLISWESSVSSSHEASVFFEFERCHCEGGADDVSHHHHTSAASRAVMVVKCLSTRSDLSCDIMHRKRYAQCSACLRAGSQMLVVRDSKASSDTSDCVNRKPRDATNASVTRAL